MGCDFLSKFRVPAYKIASYELVDIPLIKYISKKGKPIIISSGMASLNEIQEALMAIKKTKNNKVILLHCISNYPTDFKNYNLEMMNLLKKKFKVFVGLSDHSIGDYVATAASALGARVIEKHVKLAGDKISHDSKFSMNTGEFKIYCKRIKKTWECLGEADFKNRIDRNEIKHRRSIYIVKNIKKGERTTIENIKRIRPSYGLHPKFYEFVLGKKVKKNLLKGQPMKLNYLIKK